MSVQEPEVRPRPRAVPSVEYLRPRGTRLRRTVLVGREVGIVLAAVFVYFFSRGLIAGREEVAFDNAERIIAFERSLGMFVEGRLQQLILERDWMVNLANWVYIYGHWPLIALTLAWLLWRHRDEYRRFRNAIIISGAIAFVFFIGYPTAPPRFMTDYGFVDTVAERSNSYRVLQPPALTNKYAAVPSLHFGWNLIMGMAWTTVSTNPLAKVFGCVGPVLMFAAIVLTGNHYILDGVIGGVLALFGLFVATKLASPARVPRTKLATSGSAG